MRYDYVRSDGKTITVDTNYIYEAIQDPADDYLPWVVVKVYLDGNMHELCRFETEDEADGFIGDLKTNDALFNKAWVAAIK